MNAADAAAAPAGDATIVAAGRQFQIKFFRHERQELIDQEPDIVVPHAVVLETTIAASHRVLHRAGRSPGVTNTPIVTGISLVAISVSSRVSSIGLKPSVLT